MDERFEKMDKRLDRLEKRFDRTVRVNNLKK
jgi:tetrahydromethanopterin S-methyltransferase subunit G